MKIQYEFKCISGYPNVEVDFCFAGGAHEKIMLVSESSEEFEDAVLELAEQIKKNREPVRFNIGNGPITGSWDAGGNADEFKELINKFVGIIEKLTEKL